MTANVTWINHSTFLIEYKQIRILTDPIFSNRCSPFSFMGPKRYHPPGIELEQIKSLDAVFISHTHYDHLDYISIKKILQKFPNVLLFVPKGFGWWFRLLGGKRIYPCQPGDKIDIQIQGLSVSIYSLSAKHITNRYILDIGLVKAMGMIIDFEQSKRLYFVGDSAYDQTLAKQVSQWQLDLSLIPIGAYLPRWFLRNIHMDPFEAVRFHLLTGSKKSIACHWKTFRLSWELPTQASQDLQIALQNARCNSSSFQILEPGEKTAW